FPLLSRSKTLENLIGDSSDDEKGIKLEDEKQSCVLKLHDLPGGPKTFLLVAKFCYGVKLEVNSTNVVPLRCASEYLQMTEEYGEGNLINHMETFLGEVFGSWIDTLKALDSCDEVMQHAEELHIVSRCVNSLALKACAYDKDLFGWPVSSTKNDPFATVIWNGIQSSSTNQDWWYEDVSKLRLPLYRRFILAVDSRSMDQEQIAGSLMFYAKKHLPLLGRQPSFPNSNLCSSFDSNSDQKTLLEEIVDLLPSQKRIVPTKLLLRLLRTSMILHCSPLCRGDLERRIGLELDQASIEDILIPNMGYSSETLYEIDCVQRMLDHFVVAHPWLTDSDRELVCRLMDCQKLSLEASTHAAQNERLPLRFIVQVLFFEQLRLRTSVSGCLYLSDNYNSQIHLSSSMMLPESGNVNLLTAGENDRRIVAVDDMRDRVSELEKECFTMKKEIDKLVKTKGISWNSLCKMFGIRLRLKSKTRDACASSNDPGGKRAASPARIKDGRKGKNQDQENGESGGRN
ncbi:BTB/POZ fold, partial [Cynara cardunculus var. scolymus]